MGSFGLLCPNCGKKLHVLEGKKNVVCTLCGSNIAVPQAQTEAEPVSEETKPKADTDTTLPSAEQTKLNEAYHLLETDLASPSFDQNVKEAERKFMELVKENRENYLAWSGLFGCLLHQCKKTYVKQEKIPGTEYWLQPGTNVFQDFFRVEGYFNRVLVDEQGKYRSFEYDSILQPGRKARLYLENAVQTAEGEEKENMGKLLDKYFTNAPGEMAQTGLTYLLQKRAESRKPMDKGFRGKR
ncbi:hypothetical protein LJC49_07500 [Ruminococcaceae bacterium OttesenSCG-928-I18]|nr:hypothetical protein [Ruminococcaceae bacterium OttesenSCG-928-I18]